MNKITEQINSIKFEQILTHLWIKTFNKWIWIKGLYEWQKRTDGWVYDEKTNLINDFTWKRAKWDVISFLWQYLNLDFQEVLEYCKRSFWVIDDNNYKQIKKEIEIPKIDVKAIFNSYKDLWENQIEYLKSRWIDFEKVKDVVKQNNSWIACMLFNERWQAISINTRAIDKKEFRILAWTQSKWVYMWKINRDNKKVYVVEWMFDFLSLYQFWINVFWLKSINDWIDVIREFYIKGYEIILIPDNDEVWKTLLDKVKDIKYSLFDLSKYEVKDINDFLNESWFWGWIIEIIEEEKQKSWYQEEFEIVEYENTLQDWIDELDKTDPNKVISWGYTDLDNKIWYILPWQLILVWWTTWTWKSTFVWEVAKLISKQWDKVLKFTLEDRLEDRKKQDLFVEINKIRKLNWLETYPYNEFMSNNIKSPSYIWERKRAIENLIKDNKNIFEIKRQNEKQIDIANLELVIKKWVDLWCKTIVLDHLQEFRIEWDKDRHDLKVEEMMYKIKNLARKYKIVIILIAHFKKVEWKPSENSFKDSIAVAQVPNKVLLLYRDKLDPTWITELMITKNREKPDWTWIIEMNFDFLEMKYTNTISKKQIDKQNKFNWLTF